jgi:hypothetical protein
MNTKAPVQIEVFVRGLFPEPISAVYCSTERCGGAWVNGTPNFSGEHCMCSCVHPSRRAAEREGYLSTRTLHVFQRSAVENQVSDGGTDGVPEPDNKALAQF